MRVRSCTHRGQVGWQVSGKDARGRSVRVFVFHEDTARALVDLYRRTGAVGHEDEMDRMLRADAERVA